MAGIAQKIKTLFSSREFLAVYLLVMFGVINIVATYSKLSHVYDEAPHVSAGMQWWMEHRFTLEPKHPPLPRLMAAAPLYFAGRGHVLENNIKISQPWYNFWQQGSEILHSDHSYVTNLMLARAGVLPFFILSCWLVYAWARSLFGIPSALLSLASYVTLPLVAAHAGIAATDMGHAAMLQAGIMISLRWLARPGIKESLLAGCVLGLMVGTKLSALVHWPAAMLLIFLANYAVRPARRAFELSRLHLRCFFMVLPMCVLVLGALFFFDYEQFYIGLQQLYDQNRGGHATWLWKSLENRGVWYYFPVVYFFKTPVFFLITNVLSFVRILRERMQVEKLFPGLAAIAVFLSSMPSNINVGIRHVLPVYPLLAVMAGYGLWWLWQSRQRTWRGVLIGGLAWQTASFLAAYPDRIAYYNEIGILASGGHTERISPDSDLDWGQGFLQMRESIQRHHIKKLRTCFWLGGAIRDMDDTLGIQLLGCPEKRQPGWLAISRVERLLNPKKSAWLNSEIPVENVGQTIWLYHIQ